MGYPATSPRSLMPLASTSGRPGTVMLILPVRSDQKNARSRSIAASYDLAAVVDAARRASRTVRSRRSTHASSSVQRNGCPLSPPFDA